MVSPDNPFSLFSPMSVSPQSNYWHEIMDSNLQSGTSCCDRTITTVCQHTEPPEAVSAGSKRCLRQDDHCQTTVNIAQYSAIGKKRIRSHPSVFTIRTLSTTAMMAQTPNTILETGRADTLAITGIVFDRMQSAAKETVC